MARSPFPSGDFGRRVSDPVIGTSIGAPGAGAAFEVAGAAHAFGREVRGMAERAWTREGETDAAQAIAASAETGIDPRIRQGRGVDDQAYNTVIRADYSAKRQTAYLDAVDQARLAHPDNLGAFTEALTAARGAFGPTGDPQIDADFAQFVTLKNGEAVRAVRQGEEVRRVQTARGAFVNVATTAETVLGQSIASAGFDDEGAALVGASLNQFRDQLVRFGPREAFSVGGVEYAADPTRAGSHSSEELARLFDAGQAGARLTWIQQAADRSPDAASAAAFAGQVRERWANGDPMFAGLSAVQMDRLTAQLDAGAARLSAAEKAQVTALSQQTNDMLKALEYGGDVDPDQLRAVAEASGDVGLMAEVDYRLTYGFQVSPRDKDQALGGGAIGAQGVMAMLLDDLEGPGFVGNDNGRGRAQYGITEASHPEAWRDGKVDRAEAEAIYRREYLAPLGPLSPEMQAVALPAAVIGGVGTAKALLAQAGGDPERFLQLEMQRFRRLAAENPAKYGDDLRGWENRQGKIRGALGLVRQQVRQQEGFASDPLAFAQGSKTRPALRTVAPMDPLGVFGDAAAVSGWADALRSRAATGAELSQTYAVPERVLTDAETAFYKDHFEKNPDDVVRFAAGAASVLGGDRTRKMLQDLGRGGMAGADLQLATLAMDPASRPAATLALTGRALRAGGATPPKFEDGTIAEAVATISPVLRETPELGASLSAIAEDMAVADAATGRLKEPAAYVNAALGAVKRGEHVFGGLASVNGAATVLPSWARQDAGEELLEVAAAAWVQADIGPRYDSGRVIPARVLAGYQLRRVGAGYRLLNPATGAYVLGRDGKAFQFDLEATQFRDNFASRHPDMAVRTPR